MRVNIPLTLTTCPIESSGCFKDSDSAANAGPKSSPTQQTQLIKKVTIMDKCSF